MSSFQPKTTGILKGKNTVRRDRTNIGIRPRYGGDVGILRPEQTDNVNREMETLKNNQKKVLEIKNY